MIWDDGHHPSTCNYSACNASAPNGPCPFRQDKPKPASSSRLDELAHDIQDSELKRKADLLDELADVLKRILDQ